MKRMEKFPEQNPNPVLSAGKDGTILYSNVAGEPLLHSWGVRVGEILPSNVRDFVQMVISSNSPKKIEVRVDKRVYIVSFHPLSEEECVNIYGFDISDQKELEERLRESEERLRLLDDNLPDSAVYQYTHESDGSVRFLYCSAGIKKLNGVSPLDVLRDPGILHRQILPDYFEKLVEAEARSAHELSDFEIDLPMRRPDGQIRWMRLRSHPRRLSDGRTIWDGVQIDITERKKSEEALKESEERERAHSNELTVLLDAVPAAVWITHDPKALHITGNRLSYEWLRIPEGANASKSAPEGERPETFEMLRDGVELQPEELPVQLSAAGKEIRNYEFDILYPDGTIRHILGNASPLLDEYGNSTGSISAFIDITERKKVENALKIAYDSLEEKVKERTEELEKAYKSLKESEEGLAEAQKMAHIGNWDWDIATDKAYWSEELYRIFGRDPEKLAPSYNEYLSYVHPDDRDYADNAHKEALNGKTFSIDHRIVLANGEERIVHIQSETIFNDENIPIRLKGIVQDITERKRSEEKIQNLANIVESSNDAIITKSFEGIITSWNKGAEQIYGYSTKEILGKNVSILEPDNLKGEIKQLGEMIRQGEKIRDYETSRLRKDGTIIDVSITLSPVFDVSGELMAISAIARDITEHKKAEVALANLEVVRQKEIHHRIKNNLQVISSLMDLQAEKFSNRECIKNSEVLEAFRESQDRITSIALIHEELHEGEGGEALNFSLYLERLVENLLHTYSLGNTAVSLNIDLEENVFFDIDIAVPLGMIVNELVSNSLKYAFPNRETGEVQIKLFSEELAGKGTRYILIVSDNGVGIPEETDFENPETLGLQLVNILVDQLDGEIELKRDKGTEFVIGFSVEEKL